MEALELQNIIRAIIQGAGKPITFAELMAIFREEKAITANKVKAALKALLVKEDPVLELKEVAGGYRYQIKSQYAPWLQKAYGKENEVAKFSRVLKEVLAIIAYRQPITRQEIDSIRGASTHLSVFQQLEERKLVKIIGYSGTKQPAALYGTTMNFLEYFNLNSMHDLPVLAGDVNEIKEKEFIGELE
jgi:segregation and condensation protein B